MSSLSNFPSEELRNATRLRNVDGYGNMSRQQLENIFKTPAASIPPIPKSRPIPRLAIIFPPRRRRRPEPLPIDVVELEKWKRQKPDQHQKILGISGMTG